MGRSSGKEKKKGKNGKNAKEPALKVKPAKRSKFSAKNNDLVHVPKNQLLGNPTSYLYGKQAINAKRKRQSKKSNNKKHGNNFVPRNGNKRAKRMFIARFPVVGINTKAAPWIQNNNKNHGGKDNNEETQQRKIMNGAFSVDENAMKLVNSELEEFATYVKLTGPEIQAREYLIQEIQKSCRNLFGVEASQCQVFGSFGALPVCIFESDIDLAIWGVVEPDNTIVYDGIQEKKTPITKPQNSNNNNNDDDTQSRSNQKRQERVLKWKAAIDYAQSKLVEKAETSQDNNKKDSAEGGEIDEKCNSQDQTKEDPAEEEAVDGKPLFVLDRTGDASSLELSDKDAGSINDKEEDDDGVGVDVDVDDDDDDSDNDDRDKDNDFSPSQSDDSHYDNADKLENFWSRKSGLLSSTINDDGSTNDTDEEDEKVEFNDVLRDVPRGRPRGHSLVSLSSETTCSVEATMNESRMEVSFVVEANNKQITRASGVGPTGPTRTRVINSLYKLAKPLRSWAINMQVRKRARVPIINMITRFGFECDIALGGHNGTDTSSYATTQLSRFKR